MIGEMSLRGLQQALARIYTDARVCEAFLSGDEAPLSIYELSPDDLKHLRELREGARERLIFFSRLLANKQGNLLRTLLPLSRAALGEQVWGQAWSVYSATLPSEAMLKPSAKALCFLEFLETYLEQQPLQDNLQKDIIVYERCKLSVGSGFPTGSGSQVAISSAANNEFVSLYPLVQKPFLVHLFNYDLTEIIPLLNAPTSLPLVQATPTLILFYRHLQSGSIKTAKVTSWMEGLLNLCDGQTQAGCILEWLATQLRIGMEQSPSICKRLLDRLEREGVLSLQSQPSGARVGGCL